MRSASHVLLLLGMLAGCARAQMGMPGLQEAIAKAQAERVLTMKDHRTHGAPRGSLRPTLPHGAAWGPMAGFLRVAARVPTVSYQMS